MKFLKILAFLLFFTFLLVGVNIIVENIENTRQKLLSAKDYANISEDFSTISVLLTESTGNEDMLNELDYLKRKESMKNYNVEEIDENHKTIKLNLNAALEYNLTTDNNLIPIHNGSFSYPDSTLHKEIEFYLSLCINLSCENSDSYEMLSKKLNSLEKEATKNNISFNYKYISLSDHKELEYSLSGELHRIYLSSKLK